MNGGGDQLARGARSAIFGPARGISQTRWDAMWLPEEPENPQKQEPEFISKSQQNRITIQRGEKQ